MSRYGQYPENLATNIYCKLADIENLLYVMSVAAKDEEETLSGSPLICWEAMILLAKKEVACVRSLAEDLETRIRTDVYIEKVEGAK